VAEFVATDIVFKYQHRINGRVVRAGHNRNEVFFYIQISKPNFVFFLRRVWAYKSLNVEFILSCGQIGP